MRALPLVVAIALALPATAAAQETTGGVRGRLHSAAIGPVPNAQITATSPDLLGERRARSAADGLFQLALLPPGNYTLRVTAIGHRPLVIRDVVVRLGQITGLGDLALELAAVELGEVTITAPRVSLDPVRTTVGATLAAAELASLPAERDYKSAIAILPHVNTSYHGDPVNVGGSTGLENMWFIDGVNVTSTLTAISSTSLPYNFVRAVEVKAGGYEAQYGKALGAVVNAITYSGTNDLEGQVFGFFTHDALAAEPKAVPTLRETGTVSYDVGARVSGPVVRDRLWFSAAYNPRVSAVDKEIPGLGVYTDRATAHIFAGKVAWAATPQFNVELSFFGDPTVRHQVQPMSWAPTLIPLSAGPFRARRETGGLMGSLRATAAIGAGLVLEGAVARSSLRASTLPETQPDSTEPLYVDYVAGTASGGSTGIEEVSEGRTSAVLRGTVTLDRHTFVAGLEYEDARVSRTQSQPGGFSISRSDSSAWATIEESTTGVFHNRSPTAYLQDALRVVDRLSVSLGVRWSSQTLISASGAVAQRFSDEWQPRVGFNWQLGQQATQRLFGSYGRFYQGIPQLISALNFADYTFISSEYSTDPRQPGAVPVVVNDWSTTEAQGLALAGHTGLAVENFDEFTLGYERLLGANSRLTVRGIRRDLRSSFQWGFDPDPSLPTPWVIGTPGKGDFAFLPAPRREYTALELVLDGSIGRLDYRTSYVLSRTWGNYPGLYGSDADVNLPGGSVAFFTPLGAVNSTGYLPNDRKHVFKATGMYRPTPMLAVGGFLAVASGIPENDFGGSPFGIGYSLLAPRGRVGRTPTLWDLNLRLTYDLPWPRMGKCRLVLDMLHVGNPRQTVQVDQQHYFEADTNGVQRNSNPNYLRPTGYQPPMAARLGVEVSF